MSFLTNLLAAIPALVLLVAVLELVRRRRLREKYALLWILTAVVLLVLSLWRGIADSIALALGIAYGPAVIFAIAGFFFIVVLLHYSTVISALTDRTVVLAQSIAILENRVANLEEVEKSDSQTHS